MNLQLTMTKCYFTIQSCLCMVLFAGCNLQGTTVQICNVNEKDLRQALIIAAGSCYAEVDAAETVQYLLDKKANITAKNMHNKTALDCARSREKYRVIKVLTKEIKKQR